MKRFNHSSASSDEVWIGIGNTLEESIWQLYLGMLISSLNFDA
jgi:hypothetical protein